MKLQDMSIMVVGRNSFAGVACNLLRSLCNTILSASTDRLAFGVLKHTEIDFVILDELLPDDGGVDFVRRLRAAGKNTPVLLVLTEMHAENAREALHAGADQVASGFSSSEALQELINQTLLVADRKRKEGVVDPNAMKFLIVDDSLTMRRIVTNALKGQGYKNMIEACDGKEAVAKLMDEGADFVITDWSMPEMNGAELTKWLRNNEHFKHIPILMITTRGNKDDVIEGLRLGVNNYIVKPFTPQGLMEKIEQVLKSLV